MTESPFLRFVPKDPAENLRWRIKMRRAALGDKGLQDALYQAAMQDILFYFSAFLWLEDPRAACKEIPMIPWPHQIPVILKIDETIQRTQETGEKIDILVPKSREQGFTFIMAGVEGRLWLRDWKYSAGMVTRNEKDVDSKTDPGALMYKVVYMLKMLPFWMLSRTFDFEKHRSLSEHMLWNPETQATIKGSAAVANLFRGDRLTSLFFDEAGSTEWIQGGKDYESSDSTRSVTNCRVFGSTFGAPGGMFFEACQHPSENVIVIPLSWKDNPVHSKMAFVLRENVPVAREPGDQAAVSHWVKQNRSTIESLQRRLFIKDGQLVSPWYVSQCLLTGATPRGIAREIDMNARGAVGKVFDIDVLDRMLEEKCQPPVWRGKLVYDQHRMQPLGLLRQENGPLKLWFKPGLDDQARPGRYCLGFDIATGRNTAETSNSGIFGTNMDTGEQVLEYASRSIAAIEFARLGVATARWLHGALMNWDAGGPTGGAFREEVLEKIGYYNVFYRPKSAEFLWGGEGGPSKAAGSYLRNDEQKGNLFENMNMEMADNAFIPRSEDFVKECGEYELENGKIIHRPSKDKREDGAAHGDLVIAGGCCLIGIKDSMPGGIDRTKEVPQIAKYGTMDWRFQQAEAREARRRGDDGEGMSLRDLLGARNGREW